jgi:hypothetical protein
MVELVNHILASAAEGCYMCPQALNLYHLFICCHLFAPMFAAMVSHTPA